MWVGVGGQGGGMRKKMKKKTKKKEKKRKKIFCSERDLNPRPSDYKSCT